MFPLIKSGFCHSCRGLQSFGNGYRAFKNLPEIVSKEHGTLSEKRNCFGRYGLQSGISPSTHLVQVFNC